MTTPPQGWLFETTVGGLGGKPLAIAPDRIVFGDKTIPVAGIRIVNTQVVNQYVNGIPTGTNYNLTFQGDGWKQVIRWAHGSIAKAETKERDKTAYAVLDDFLMKAVGPRLADEAVARMHGPEPMKVGALILGPELVVKKLMGAKTIPWAAVAVEHLSMQAGAWNVMVIDQQNQLQRIANISLLADNATFLHILLNACRTAATQGQAQYAPPPQQFAPAPQDQASQFAPPQGQPEPVQDPQQFQPPQGQGVTAR